MNAFTASEAYREGIEGRVYMPWLIKTGVSCHEVQGLEQNVQQGCKRTSLFPWR